MVEEIKYEAFQPSVCYAYFHFIPKWTDLDKIIWLFSCSIKKITITRGPIGAIFHFILILTNLKETLWHNSCSIETTYFNL